MTVRHCSRLDIVILLLFPVGFFVSVAAPPGQVTLPKAVMDALNARFPNAVIEESNREKEDGRVMYDVEFTQDGRKLEADLLEDGTIDNWENEIASDDLPSAVTKAMGARHPGVVIGEVMAVTRVRAGEETLEGYEISFETKHRKRMEVTFAPDGFDPGGFQERRLTRSMEMRASVFVGTSLDGFIARLDGSLDFLPPGGGEPHGFDEFMASVDAHVIGRKTYETVIGFDGWAYGEKPVFVLSDGPLAPAPPGAVVERMSGEPVAIASRLEARGIRHAYVDGGITIQQFLRAGLIQRMIITRVPVLIGEGIPLFGAVPTDIILRHVGTRCYASGLVQSEYEVVARQEGPSHE